MIPRSFTYRSLSLKAYYENATTAQLMSFSGGVAGGFLALCLTVSALSTPPAGGSSQDYAAYVAPEDVLLSEEAAQEPENIRAALMSAWKELDLQATVDESAAASDQAALPAETAEVVSVPAVTYPYETSMKITVESGDTLAALLQQKGISYTQAHRIIQALKRYYDPRDLRVGQSFTLTLNHESENTVALEQMVIAKGRLTQVEIRREGEEGYRAAEKVVPTDSQLARAGGVITSSFYQTGADAGLPAPLIAELMKAYSYDVDFERDIKPGQTLDVMFEQLVAEDSGKVVGYGDVKYAAFKMKNKPIEIFKYTDKKGETGYYKPNGESVRKALLKTPVNARISSRFGMRKHPILGYSRMHSGIDFAAMTGTPIYAAGDGVVNYAARKGGYGNYIRIKHNGTYQTAYAHLSKFAKGIRNGKRVKQGQVIGYVGSTGRSTGPHLHYEILKYGKHINPHGVKFPTGRQLKGTELAAFKKQQGVLKQQFAALPRIREQVAQADID